MARIPENQIERLKRNVPIEKLVAGFGERDGELRLVPPRPRRSRGRQGAQRAALANRHRAAPAGLSAARP